MICDDWGDVPAASVAPLFEQEHRRWMDGLHWDLQDSLALMERARTSRHLPGLVVRDRRRQLAGWTFYLLRNEVLEIGSLVGRSASAVRALLDAVIDCPEAELARRLSCFVFPTASSVRSALVRRHFEVSRFRYLARRLPTDVQAAAWPPLGPLHIRGWNDVDAVGTVRLLANAYADESTARCFAPNGELSEWAQYVGQLLGSPGCGLFLPATSVVAEERSTRTLVGAVLATRIAADTVHLAQVAVDPGMWGRRLGARLVRTAMAAARAAGFERITLLVADENRRAQALYERLGFEATSEFLFGSRARPARRAVLEPRRTGPPSASVEVRPLAAAS